MLLCIITDLYVEKQLGLNSGWYLYNDLAQTIVFQGKYPPKNPQAGYGLIVCM